MNQRRITGRPLHATLDLLDRQLRDRNGVLCGNVDDLELTRDDETGQIYVTAILAGSGALAYRLGGRRLGRWLHEADRRLHEGRRNHGRIPMELTTSIGPAIDLAIDAHDQSTHDLERWTRVHVIDHIPGGSHRAGK